MRRALAVLAAAAPIVAPAIARAQAAQTRTIAVKVVEVAGGRAYLSPGAKAGLAAGATVQLGGKTYTVIDATDDDAAIDVGGDPVAIGATGAATVVPGASARVIEKLPAPAPQSAFTGQWNAAVHPADVQSVKPVALGTGKRRGPTDVTLFGAGMLFAPRGGSAVAVAQAGARVSYQPYGDTPLAFDAEAAGQVFHTHGGDDAARPNLVVAEARARWGSYADPRVAIGRLRWAATSLGLLDGARVAHALGGGVELAGFGGAVPDPLSGKPSLDAERFGAELLLDRPRAAWAPRLSLTAYGSTWKGALDERRLEAVGDAARGPVTFGGYAELSSFASDNPWGEPALRITSAGADASWRDGGLRLGLDASYRQPEHSLRLDAYLPPEWQVNDARSEATASASWLAAWGSIDAGATAIHTSGAPQAIEGAGYGDLRLRFGGTHVELGGSGGRTSFLSWAAADAGLGFVVRKADITIYYRPEMLDYSASTATFLEQRGGVEARWSPRPDVVYGAIVEGQTGNDLDALTALVTIIWRPR